MDAERAACLRELELEYRYLGLVKLEAKMARVMWLEKLTDELMASLRAFWAGIEAGEA